MKKIVIEIVEANEVYYAHFKQGTLGDVKCYGSTMEEALQLLFSYCSNELKYSLI